jgi:hypothetical protein
MPNELRAKTGLPLLGVVTMLTDRSWTAKHRRASLYRFVFAVGRSGGLVHRWLDRHDLDEPLRGLGV